MGMKFLNKKGWHTGSLRNIERVWVAEEKEKEEQRKIQELKKQQDEEREKAAFRKLQEDAGLKPRQERLDFLYESGLAVGKGSSEGFQALQPSAPAAAAASSSAQASAGSSKAAAPGALFEDKPQSANDAWRKLHSDPLLLIRQREQDAIARIKNNPIKMAEIKKSVEAEKMQKEEKKEKRKHKKHRHHKSRSKRHHSNQNSDSEESDGKDERRKSVHSSSEHKREEKRLRRDKKDQGQGSEDDEPGKSRKEKKGQREDSEDDKPKKSRKDCHRHDSEDEEPRRKHQTSEDDEPRRRQSEVAGDDEPRRRRQEISKHDEYSRRDRSDADDRRGRHYAPSDRNNAYSKHDSSDSRHRRPEYGRGNSTSELGSEGQRRQESQQGSNRSTFNRRRGVHHMSEEEREARLHQMQADAEVHEEQRWSRLKKAADDDAKEVASLNANQFRGKNFLEEEKKSIFGTEKGGSATIEESIRRRAYYSQRNAHESNAFRR
ncbi:hypothetical protein E2562_018152 [Oryza meyeriana var. granulata]|uniref:CBF1-interacting co-repressor CIR N-terminal domain-containing protein n=1 Tax=Oryza meyeriana var. granulata TaxID=110450 RepID=A0A6G1C796_9ORYZ|nr:hypothetical protein E2562_018152 [Oryza meyeriana var. granulata]